MKIRHPMYRGHIRGQIRRDDVPGGDGGGGGGGAPSSGSGGVSATPSSTPSSTPSGPSEPAAMHYDSDRDPTPQETQDVRNILAKEDDPNHTLSFAEIRKFLGHPMKFQPNQTSEPTDPDPAPGAVDPNAPAVVDPNKPAQPTLDPNVAALVAALSQVVPQGGQPQNPNPNPAQPAAPKRYYGDENPALAIAPELSAAIFNAQDPAQAHEALNHLINGLANRMHDDIGKRMYAVMSQVVKMQPQMVQQQISSTNQTQAFFAKFSELNKPAFQPVVAEVAKAIRADYAKRGVPIDDKFIDTVGDTVHKFLEQQMGVSFRPQKIASTPTPAPGAPKPNPAANGQKFYTPGGARQADAVPNGKAKDWRDLVI